MLALVTLLVWMAAVMVLFSLLGSTMGFSVETLRAGRRGHELGRSAKSIRAPESVDWRLSM